MSEDGIELSKISKVRMHFDAIRQLLIDGYKLPQIVVWLKERNIDISLITLKTYLYREGLTAKAVKKLSHEKVFSASRADVKTVKPIIANQPNSNTLTNRGELPEIRSKRDFKKISESIEIDFDLSPEKLAEANRILERK